MSGSDLKQTLAYRSFGQPWSDPVLVACSGGTDSAALVVLAAEARERNRVGPFVVAHVDHQSRPGSNLESESVRNLCRRVDAAFVPLTVGASGDIPGRSREDLWRERRYQELATAARRLGIETIVTAHTRDDQVETVLMRTLSGSSRLTIRAESTYVYQSGSIRLLRPLLDRYRSDLEDVLRVADVRPVEDPSNADVSFRRNAVRLDVVPVLERVFPGFDSALLRSAGLREMDADYCDEVATATFLATTGCDGRGGLVLQRRLVNDLPMAIATRMILLASRQMIQHTDDRELSAERVMAVLAAARRRKGARIELPYGVRVDVNRRELRFSNDCGEKAGG